MCRRERPPSHRHLLLRPHHLPRVAAVRTITKPHAAINVVIADRVSSTKQSQIVVEPPLQASSPKRHCLRSHPNSMDTAPPSSISHNHGSLLLRTTCKQRTQNRTTQKNP
ncbi:hypothetical protein LR48_Vigan07g151200 [Vigna angularis]|uniref:Uncharacterized protein n=1 Tax=Phaseolus angularis TaxID=3914 RepID=A0A0L9UYF1_PHAAN|nr:hypothetical protein LR48_Vigan07g151200 [Vigna angularis]